LVPCLLGLAELDRQQNMGGLAWSVLDDAQQVAERHHIWDDNAYGILMTRAEIRRDEGNTQEARELGQKAKLFIRTDPEKKAWKTFFESL